MTLRKAGNGDVEMVTKVVTDVSDQIDGLSEAVFDGLPLRGTSRRVASQSQNIFTPMFFRFLQQSIVSTRRISVDEKKTHHQSLVHLLSRHVGASQVHAGLKTELFLGCSHELGGGVRRATTCNHSCWPGLLQDQRDGTDQHPT